MEEAWIELKIAKQRFWFEVPSIALGARISLSSALALALGGVLHWRRRRRPEPVKP